MKLTFLSDNQKQDELNFNYNQKQDEISVGLATCKFQQVKDFLSAYNQNGKIILVDSYNKQTVQNVKKLNLNIFKEIDFNIMLFTSGTTANAKGVFKNKKHLESEIAVLSRLFKDKNFKKVIVTVPFIHIYGILFGLLLPKKLQATVIIKQHFLPHDIINECDEGTLVVTTPLYIKSLTKLQHEKDISKTTFVSSTAPLAVQVVDEFVTMYKTDIYQFFGSTETGGIAYKKNSDKLWTPLEKVNVTQDSKGLMRVDSPFISDAIFNEKKLSLKKPYQTFDYIQSKEERFELIGRDAKIVKIAGKRYSTIDIEAILEDLEGIEKVLVQNCFDKNSLRGESLKIYIEGEKVYKKREIKKILQQKLSNIAFEFEIIYLDDIPVSQTGKKLFIKDLS